MKEYTVRISGAEEKALKSSVLDIQEWINNAIHARARRAIDLAIEEYTTHNPRKLSEIDRETLIAELPLKTVTEKEAALLEKVAPIAK